MKPRAVCLLRDGPAYRKEAFIEGLRNAGYDIVPNDFRGPSSADVLLIWNRYGGYDEAATQWERGGGRVLVVENGYLGKSWRGESWNALAQSHHCGAGHWAYGGPERWDNYGVELQPWRTEGSTLILAQRGIGEQGIRSPEGWAESVQAKYGGRIRLHPGKDKSKVSLADDLEGVGRVLTWHSGAALHCLLMGIPVWYAFDSWLGGCGATPLSNWPVNLSSDAQRLAMFRNLAWTNWSLDEIRSGQALTNVLSSHPRV